MTKSILSQEEFNRKWRTIERRRERIFYWELERGTEAVTADEIAWKLTDEEMQTEAQIEHEKNLGLN